MTARDASQRDMDPFELDAGTADRLLTGAMGVDDAPPRYRSVAVVLHALREELDGAELCGGSTAVDGVAAAVVFETRGRPAQRLRRRRFRAGLLAAASVVSCVLLTGGLAAAGALPAPAQRAASAVLSHVGISVPAEDESHADQEDPSAISAPAPAVAGPAQSDPAASGSDQPSSATGGPGPASAPAPADAPANAPVSETHPPDANGDGTADTPTESPPGNGNGNAYGLGNGNANAEGYGNGLENRNVNAYGLDIGNDPG